jgi:DNA polymerase III subunit delta
MVTARVRGGVHAILGADSFLAEAVLERLLEEALGQQREGALEVLHGDESTWGRLVEMACTGSLFVTRRALVVRGADGLKGDEGALEGYLDDPSPDVTLVLMAVKPDRRRTAWKRITAKATVHSAEPKKGKALRDYVAEQLRGRGLRLDHGALEELIERVGQDLRRLIGEIDKLEAWAEGKQRPLTAEDVAEVSGRGMARPLYRLGDAIAGREPATALALVEELLENGEEAPLILGTVHRSLRQMRAVLSLRDARVPRDQMAERLKLPGNMAFKVQSLLELSRRWSDGELGRALHVVTRADRLVKTGTDPRVALAAAIVAACGRGSAARAGEARPSPRPVR